jgi:putative transposase
MDAWKLSGAERSTLGEIGHRLGRTALAEVATVAKPDTILAWYRKLVAHKFDGSKARRGPGQPRVTHKQLIVRLAEENRDWGYDRIAGALTNLGYRVCDQTVGCPAAPRSAPAPERKRTTTWSVFIRIHLALLASTDFFTAEVLTLRGLVTYCVLFFIHLESRRWTSPGSPSIPTSHGEAHGTRRDHGRMRDPTRLPLSPA